MCIGSSNCYLFIVCTFVLMCTLPFRRIKLYINYCLPKSVYAAQCACTQSAILSFREKFWRRAIRSSVTYLLRNSNNFSIRQRLQLFHCTLRSSTFVYIGCHVIKFCTKCDRNRTVRGWVIDDWTNFPRWFCFSGKGTVLSGLILWVGWIDL